MSEEYFTDLETTASASKWESVGHTRRAGCVVPLFSVFSSTSIGSGDFSDLKRMVDWTHQSGLSIIQLLPMNDVGSAFCPYDSCSSFALEPMYMVIPELAHAKDKPIKAKINELKEAYPAGKEFVDYGVKHAKLILLREICKRQTAFDAPKFQHFRQDNSYWLQDYALFKVLKEYHEGRPWYEWEDQYKNRDPEALESFRKYHDEEIMFQMWVQWQLSKQFKDAKEYAASRNIILKGDLPILVSRDSADVWMHPYYFKLEYAAGAPPDMYCAKGQRWGMPTYNWERIATDNFRYLKERLKYASNYYDCIRIDHVVGLFRIWSIPYEEPHENQGLNGFFDPRDESRWKEHGSTILSFILNHTSMLLCAEDLGVVPVACTQTLQEQGIPGNDVQRWVKDWGHRHDFLRPEEYRFLSVAMLSTHDTTSWSGWWENEAGTIDEALFMRRAAGRFDGAYMKERLFDKTLSRHGRLRWHTYIDSVDALAYVLGKRKDEIADFIDMYLNSYQEKEKFWKLADLPGDMREKADTEILAAAFKLTLDAKAVFSIHLITDWLALGDLLRNDPYSYRINMPGTVDPKNWSLVMPISLDELIRHPLCSTIKEMVAASGRE